MMLPKPLTTVFTLVFLVLGIQPAAALTLPFSGTFVEDNDVQYFTFSLAGASHVDITTTSFGDGGFLPWLRVWDAATGEGQGSSLLATPDNAEAVFSFDSTGPGNYIGAVFAWHNYPPQDFITAFDSTEFRHSGSVDNDPFYLWGESGCSSGHFSFDFGGGCENRTGNWALNISSADLTTASLYPDTSAVPEPATLALALAGWAGFAPFTRRRLVALA